jgi:hypothetical protein
MQKIDDCQEMRLALTPPGIDTCLKYADKFLFTVPTYLLSALLSRHDNLSQHSVNEKR